MINVKKARSYCKDDISRIENYNLAIIDNTQTWDLHHRRETIFTRQDLIEIGEYYRRPAMELIFLTKEQHMRLHHSGNRYCLGKHLSEETRQKMTESKPKKTVLQFSKDGEFIKEYPSIREAARQTKINHSSVIQCCKGQRKTAGGYVWQYAS